MKTTESIAMTGGVMTTKEIKLGEYLDWDIQLHGSLEAPGFSPRGSTVAAGDSGIQVVTSVLIGRL